jgi:circadian clock protein KaiC
MRVSTGIQGLDQILRGGLVDSRVYLVHGDPGTGKTALGLHFLAAGILAHEPSLLITFGQAETHIRADAKSLGLNIDDVSILDLTPAPETFSEIQTYDIFSPYEVEREPMALQISRTIEQTKARRIFVDSFSHFRQVVSDTFHHDRLVQSFFRFATYGGATLIVASDDSDVAREADGVIHLDFSNEGRSVRVTKFRGSDFQAGHHPMRVTAQGIEVLPNVA